MPPAHFRHVTPIARMRGDDEEETALLAGMLADAQAYVRAQRWCGSIDESWWGDGVGGVVAVFLFHVRMHGSQKTRAEWVWVICGDLPTMYLDSDEVHEPIEALRTYGRLCDDWVAVVQAHGDLRTVFPLAAEPTAEHAAMLASRIALLRDQLIPALIERRSAGAAP